MSNMSAKQIVEAISRSLDVEHVVADRWVPCTYAELLTKWLDAAWRVRTAPALKGVDYDVFSGTNVPFVNGERRVRFLRLRPFYSSGGPFLCEFSKGEYGVVKGGVVLGEWFEWSSEGRCPIPAGVAAEVTLRNGEVKNLLEDEADIHQWHHKGDQYDIISINITGLLPGYTWKWDGDDICGDSDCLQPMGEGSHADCLPF